MLTTKGNCWLGVKFGPQDTQPSKACVEKFTDGHGLGPRREASNKGENEEDRLALANSKYGPKPVRTSGAEGLTIGVRSAGPHGLNTQ